MSHDEKTKRMADALEAAARVFDGYAANYEAKAASIEAEVEASARLGYAVHDDGIKASCAKTEAEVNRRHARNCRRAIEGGG